MQGEGAQGEGKEGGERGREEGAGGGMKDEREG